MRKLNTFKVTDEVLEQLAAVIDRYREVYVEKRFKSSEILEALL